MNIEKNQKEQVQLEKNRIVEITIEDMGTDGEGIGKVDGFPLFVKDAVIGDRIIARILKVKKTYGYAKIEELLVAGESRVTPKCTYADRCGGCQLQNYSYEAQLECKTLKVKNNLMRIGGFDSSLLDEVFEPIIGMDVPYYYRNKAQYPVGMDRDGNIVTGFYAFHSHRIVPADNCCLNTKGCDVILETVKEYMKQEKIRPYDEETGKGLVRHILIRKGFASGEWMVCIVINDTKSSGLANADKLIGKLSEIPGMTSISCCFNTRRDNVIMGDTVETLWGRSVIRDSIGGIEFEISPLSFYQVNPIQTEKLYGKALEYALQEFERKNSGAGMSTESDSGEDVLSVESNVNRKNIIWDVYCGIGTISLFLAKGSPNSKVYGVEIIPQAIADAENNARRNNIKNVEFFVGKAEEVLPDYYARTGEGADVIIVDPPRKGCDISVLETMLRMGPERIVYVSCDSATLARDLKILTSAENEDMPKYELKKVCPCDMFGQTAHVETCVLLSRGTYRHAAAKVKIDVELEDYYAIKDSKKEQGVWEI